MPSLLPGEWDPSTINLAKWAPGLATVASSLLGMEGANTQAEGADIAGQGALLSGAAARLDGYRRRVAAEFQAEQLDMEAGQAVAAAQRAAIEQRRAASLAASRAMAVAGAAGVDASDPSMVRLISTVAGEGYLRAASALYAGNERARIAAMGAAGKRYEGAMAEELGIEQEGAYGLQAAGMGRQAAAYRLSGMGSIAQGAAGLFAKYGGSGPKDVSGTQKAAPGWADSWGDDGSIIADAWLDF